MSILITGFGPYEKYKMNPAQLIARELDGKEILGVKIVGKEVPVSFKRVIKIIPEYIKEIRPRVFLGLGLACGRPNITLERVAINIMDATKPDNDGYKPEDEPILPNGPAAYFATLPLKRILKVLRKNGIPAMISNSAGTFVCNTLMYVALHTVNELKLDCPTGFIHVPCMPEQVVDKPQPSMSFGIMVKAVKMAVEEVLKYDTVGAIMVNDDWGFKTQTMFPPKFLREYVVPWHRKFAEVAHAAGRPVLMHSCGNLREVWDDIIDDIKVDGKHSYEDGIQPVEEAYEEYGSRIAILGGIDMDFLCRKTPEEIYNRSAEMIERTNGCRGYALGSGNSIPGYVPIENYEAMTRAVLEKR